MLTKLDVLDELDIIKICVTYKLNGEDLDYLPFPEVDQASVQPNYINLPGWKTSTFGIKKWDDLPIQAKEYVLQIEKLIETKISIISTGPERTQTIDRNELLNSI